eukprot:CAMPEP_0206376060 /NCGR_PEP_ID=MMETSP0294-20121207/9249_1 /ASSEMBLY_ACC=CAM_ASM_000327 /TAXON_ID=39354 /ORGANISM="Heterosigma akashiwo, Strain CCMP2393" /LENGTH=52 /DNA_ID=CAMNT_0053824097 /DNA_START=265 /DNA_END=420 /DNA_ORIENTATION=+
MATCGTGAQSGQCSSLCLLDNVPGVIDQCLWAQKRVALHHQQLVAFGPCSLD